MKAATVAGTVMAAAAWARRARVVRSVRAWWAVWAWSHRLRTRPWDGEVCHWCATPLGPRSAMCPAQCEGWESWIRDGLADIYRRAAEPGGGDPDVPR